MRIPGPLPAQRKRWLATLALACAAAGAASPARATLGEPAASVAADRSRLGGALGAGVHALASGPAISVQTITLADGSSIRQYLSPAGRVFAVAWTMHYKPRLDQLLGTSFAAYAQAGREAAQRRPGVMHNAVVQTGDLVVESSGHLNVYVGRAYLRSMVPAAGGLDAIR